MRITGVGFFVVFCLLLGTGGGYWLDDRFGTSPWLLIAGLVLGLTLAIFGVYLMVKPFVKDTRNKENNE